MGRPIIKFLTDFGPLLIFFIIYFKNGQDLKFAIPPFIVATLLSLTIVKIELQVLVLDIFFKFYLLVF